MISERLSMMAALRSPVPNERLKDFTSNPSWPNGPGFQAGLHMPKLLIKSYIKYINVHMGLSAWPFLRDQIIKDQPVLPSRKKTG